MLEAAVVVILLIGVISLLKWAHNAELKAIDAKRKKEKDRISSEGRPAEDLGGLKSKDTGQNAPHDETVKLLQQIEKNTAETAESSVSTLFWTRIIGLPVAIGFIVGAVMAMEKCS
jgi:hypothetical protein